MHILKITKILHFTLTKGTFRRTYNLVRNLYNLQIKLNFTSGVRFSYFVNNAFSEARLGHCQVYVYVVIFHVYDK